MSDYQAVKAAAAVIRAYPAQAGTLTDADIEAGKSARGGFTREQLAAWGVPWPPPKGWRARLTADRTVRDMEARQADKEAGA
jgi:hypothetical protein